MNKRSVTLLISFMILLPITNLVGMSGQLETKNIASTANTDIIYVDDDNTEGPWSGTLEYPYQYIHDGVLNATDDDTVYVFNGLYNETLTIDKPIILIGEDQTGTIIDGVYEEFIIHVIRDNVSIMNFTLRNSGGYQDNAGIKLDSDNNSITECNIYRTKTGIYVNGTRDNQINNCIFHTTGEGIFLKTSSENEIKNCQFCHNAIGINLQNSKRNKIYDSYVHTNGIGVFLNDSLNIEIVRCAVSDNNDNQGGIYLIGCSNVDIENCNICHNGVGFRIAGSSNISIERCNLFWNTHVAIRLYNHVKDVVITNCEIAHSFRYGIDMDNSCCKINRNNFYNNSLYGLHSKSSFCDARHNWWGLATGPALTGFGIADRITRRPVRVLCFPWYLRPLQSIGSDWETSDVFTKIEIPDDVHKPIEFPENDTDDDGCPDWWEEEWEEYDPNVWEDHANLDPDDDGLNNIEECFTHQWGSNPFHKDLFIEFDWVETRDPEITNRPQADLMERMISAFEKHDITLHIDNGSLGGGEEVPYTYDFSYADLRDYYWDYFLHNDLDNPRKGVFHYSFICSHGPSGGFAFVGWDHLDSHLIAIEQLLEKHQLRSRGWAILITAMHETGHTLGLFVDDFEGNDNRGSVFPWYKEFWLYRNYKSSMNYRYTWKILDYSDGTNGRCDFDDWGNLDFYFFKNTHFEWPKD